MRLEDLVIIEDHNQSIIKLSNIEYQYDNDEVLSFLSRKPSAEDLNKTFKFKYLKSFNDVYCCIIPTDEGRVLVAFDETRAYRSARSINVNTNTQPSEIEKLSIGVSISEVKNIHPEGDYSFLLASWSEYPKISYHFFKDGEGYCLIYDEDNYVKSINKFIM